MTEGDEQWGLLSLIQDKIQSNDRIQNDQSGKDEHRRQEPATGACNGFELRRFENIRPLNVHLLYPAKSEGKPALFGGNPALYGFEAIPDALRVEGRFPLVLLSHGLYGCWSKEGWLAAELVKSGMIVAAPTHPGTAWVNKEPLETPKLWERPRDLSRIIDYVKENEGWREAIDGDHIAAIGHSLGGYTAVAMAGGRIDHARYCEAHPNRNVCQWTRKVGLGADEVAIAKLESSLVDLRLTAAISLDLGFTPALDPTSIAAIDIPVLVIGAGHEMPEMPLAEESRHFAEMLPKSTSTYREIAAISHFSFFAECKPGAVDLLALAGEGGEVVCGDGNGRDRKMLHEEIIGLIKTFLKEAGFRASS